MSSSSPSRSVVIAVMLAALAVAQPRPSLAQLRPSLFLESARPAASVTVRKGTARTRRVAFRSDLLTAALVPGSAARAPFVLNLFADVVVAIERERLEVNARGQAAWVGAVVGDAGSLATLTWDGRHMAGSVVTRGVAYEFASDGSGEAIVRQRLPMEGLVELAPRLPRDPPALRADQPAAPAATAPVIDLLIFYTAAARTRAGGTAQIELELANAVAVTNTAFLRSAANATIRAVNVAEVPYVESAAPGQPIVYDLEVMSPGGAASAAVETARTLAGADLVMLITGRATPQACGIAWIGPSPAAVYSVTEQACLFAGQWSFSHELGHNFGADHAPGDSVQQGVAYARGYRAGAVRTLMAYADPSAYVPRILNYSSATVVEPAPMGSPTGTSLQDNARRINETAAILANYTAMNTAPAPPTAFAASVSGTSVTLSWAPAAWSTEVSSFTLEAGPTAQSSIFGQVSLAQSPAVFTDVPPGTYYLRLRSSGPGGVSAPTPDVIATVAPPCVPPGRPTLSVSFNGGTVTLTWSSSAGSSLATYVLGVGTEPGTENLGIYQVGTLSTLVASPLAGTYYVRVAATNSCGAGPASATVAVTVP